MEDLQKIKECPDCASTNILYSQSRDQVICRDCGLIFEPLVLDMGTKFEKARGLGSKGKKAKPSKPAKKAKPTQKKKAAKKPSKAKKRR